MTLRRLTPINGDAVLPLADAKQQCRVLHNDEDALIAALRDAAIAHVEKLSGIALAPADFEWSTRRYTESELPMRPVTAVTATEADGITTATFTAGIATPADAPDLIAAVRLMLGHLYAHREAVGSVMAELPLGVQALVDLNRRILV